jgi:hypothetical protein
MQCRILWFNPPCIKNKEKIHNQRNARSYASIPLVYNKMKKKYKANVTQSPMHQSPYVYKNKIKYVTNVMQDPML